ncbi:MAG: inositol monophosphatase [Nitriliruptor sp.]|uniref:inositol monophosphatase n=1 Tax=Nitriliruptor sp. TaxID=2448056 RepID=UPI00349FF8A5
MSARDPRVDTLSRALVVMDGVLDDLSPSLLAQSGRTEPTAKHDGTPVTDADHEADHALTRAIRAAFPAHGIVSEEQETVAPDTDWCWIIDPIDGTSNFTAGLPYWCVSVALALEGEVQLAVVDAPPFRRRTVALRGSGTTRGGRTMRVRDAVDWHDGRNRHVPVMLTTGTARRTRSAGLRLNPRIMGATALDLATVADGTAAASIALIPKVWDVAAGALLVTEAGGGVVTLHGEPLLPLRPGVEYDNRAAVTAAGPDEGYVRDLTAGLLPPT